jgi:N-acyl-D-aspartate/D-glutamate deacylase
VNHDLLIRGARVVDGTGAAARRADVAVTDGRIAAIGRDLGAARRTVEADGLALMPGIVDNHTHYDAQITWDPDVAPSPALGVTTVIIGNCGFTIAPCRPADRDRVMRNLTQVEGMSLEALRRGIRWDFETVAEYLDAIERRGAAVNVAAFAGHSSIRTWVMGDDAVRRAATDDEIGRMRRLLREAIDAGAIGFATSTSPAHNGEAGVPMPSRMADERELRALVGVLGEAGRGTLAPGQAADLLLFDPATVGRGPRRRVFDLPGGAPRLHTDAVGVHGVWVAGVQVADAGGRCGDARPGRLLRDAGR